MSTDNNQPSAGWALLKPEYGNMVAIPIDKLAELVGMMKVISPSYESGVTTFSLCAKPIDIAVMTADQMRAIEVRARLISSTE
jgi:hypothetical protein